MAKDVDQKIHQLLGAHVKPKSTDSTEKKPAGGKKTTTKVTGGREVVQATGRANVHIDRSINVSFGQKPGWTKSKESMEQMLDVLQRVQSGEILEKDLKAFSSGRWDGVERRHRASPNPFKPKRREKDGSNLMLYRLSLGVGVGIFVIWTALIMFYQGS